MINTVITVVLATYNGALYIREQLDSLVGQSFQDFVCYIHDDGSTDDTISIIKEYENMYPDTFKVFEYETQGSAKNNFYSLLRLTQTPFVMFCDQDDVWKTDKIEKEYDIILKETNINPKTPCLVFTDMEVVDKDLNQMHASFFDYMSMNNDTISFKSTLIDSPAAGCTMIMNKPLVDLINGLDRSPLMHDMLACQLAACTGKVIKIPESTMLYRQHQNNCVGAKRHYKIRIIDKIVNGRWSIPREYIDNPRIQAKAIAKIIDPTNPHYQFVLDFANIEKKNKIYRIIFYWKNNLFNPKSNKMWISIWL